MGVFPRFAADLSYVGKGYRNINDVVTEHGYTISVGTFTYICCKNGAMPSAAGNIEIYPRFEKTPNMINFGQWLIILDP